MRRTAGLRGHRRTAALLACLMLLVLGAAIAAARAPGSARHLRHHVPRSTVAPAPAPAPATVPGGAGWNVLSDPIDPTQLGRLPFCRRSFWLQPWRAYLDTPRVSALADAGGLNVNVPQAQAPRVFSLMAASGLRRARVEVGWDQVSFADPTRLQDPAGFTAELRAARAGGIRPLLLLNANQVSPGPSQVTALSLLVPAAPGTRTVVLDAASRGLVTPGLTAIDTPTGEPAVFITGVSSSGTAELSAPLPFALGAGPINARTLRYPPFGAPYGAGGALAPAFKTSLQGWLAYVSAVTHAAEQALGGQSFDVEVWNELSFGSAFLDAGHYYSPLPGDFQGTGDPGQALLEQTVRWIRDPANGVSNIGIGDGFASQTPFAAGSSAPPGLTALDKHPYAGARTLFGAGGGPRPCAPVDAQGNLDGQQVDGAGNWQSAFTPTFTDYFPEYYLTALQGETLIRDLAPLTTQVLGVDHGRATHPTGSPAPQLWVTETNMDSSQVALAPADRDHMLAKTALRTLVAYVNKGASAVDFYAASGPVFGLLTPAAIGGAGGPGDVLGAIGRMMGDLGADATTRARPLNLLSVAQQGQDAQFQGDGSPAHPALYNRDVAAFLPFQGGDHRWVAAAYVMTRNVAQDYGADPSGTRNRYDLPPEPFRFRISGLDPATARVSAYDPLADRTVAAAIVGRDAQSVTVQLDLTDSQRMLHIADGPATPAPSAPARRHHPARTVRCHLRRGRRSCRRLDKRPRRATASERTSGAGR